MLKSCRKLSMTVKSPNLPPPPLPIPSERDTHTGRPGSPSPWHVRQTYSWMDRQGRPVSPPPEYARASPPVLPPPPPPPPPLPRYYKAPNVRKVTTKLIFCYFYYTKSRSNEDVNSFKNCIIKNQGLEIN